MAVTPTPTTVVRGDLRVSVLRTPGALGTSLVAWAEVPPALSPWVEALWYSEGWLDARYERVLPSATGDLVVNLGPDMRLVRGAGDPCIRGATTNGLMSMPFVLGHPEWHRAVGFRLRPLGLRALLGVPMGLLNDRCTAVEDILGAPGRVLTARCMAASTPEEVLAVATDWACDRLRRGDAPDPIAAWAVGALEACGGQMGMRTLAARAGYGETWFTRRFAAEVGFTPKRFARLVRFRAALAALQPERPLVEVALSTGHADQAHLCAEFQAFAGRTPTEVLATRYTAGLTLAELEAPALVGSAASPAGGTPPTVAVSAQR